MNHDNQTYWNIYPVEPCLLCQSAACGLSRMLLDWPCLFHYLGRDTAGHGGQVCHMGGSAGNMYDVVSASTWPIVISIEVDMNEADVVDTKIVYMISKTQLHASTVVANVQTLWSSS